MPSFDVVSELNLQEVKNALEQVKRELFNRYDFKGSKASIELDAERAIIIVADDQMKLKAMQEMWLQRAAKRGLSQKSFEFKDPSRASGDALRQEVVIKQGLSSDDLKALNKMVKDSKLKVSSQAQGDQLRVTGKSRDDLQKVMAILRDSASNLALQFVNFRD